MPFQVYFNPFKSKLSLLIIMGMIFLPTRGHPENPKHRRERLVPLPSPAINQRKLAPTDTLSARKGTPEQIPSPKSDLNRASIGANKTCPDKHSIEALIQIPSHHSPAADPKGGVYFISDLREAPQVFHLDTPKSWPNQISFFSDGVVYFKLSPDGNKLLFATHVGGDEQYDIYLYEKDKLSPLLVDRGKRVESVAWDPSSTWFAYTSNARNKTDMDLYRYDLKTRESKILVELEGTHTVSDISDDGRWIALERFRSVTDSDVLLWDSQKSQLLNVTEHSGQVASEGGLFAKDSKGLFFLSDGDKGVYQLYFVSLAHLGQRKLLSSGTWGIEELALDPSRTHLAYTRNEEGYSVLEGIEIDKTGQKGRFLALPKLTHSIIKGLSFSPTKTKQTLFFSENATLFPSRIIGWSEPKKTQWTPTSEQSLRPECFSREQLVHYPSFDKLEIPGFLYTPQGINTEAERQPIPFIIFIHGGPESQFRPVFSKIFQYFLERGFGVFAPNVRGSLGYGREYTQKDNYKKRMDSVKDGIEAAKWLLKERYSKSGELALYGGSYGGFMVLAMLEESPELFSAASESVGIANFVTFLQNTKPYRRALREIEYGPLSDLDFLKSISPIHSADKIKTPLIIFHGANDPRVPVSETEQIVQALKKKDIEVEFKIFSDEGHGNTKLRNILEQAKQMIYFFEKQFKEKKKAEVATDLQ